MYHRLCGQKRTMPNDANLAATGALISYGSTSRTCFDTPVSGRQIQGCEARRCPGRICEPVNLKSAKALGLGIPPTLLADDDEVIE